MSRTLQRAVSAILLLLSAGGCSSAAETGEPVHSYVSTDNHFALIVGKGRYRFGPQLLAGPDEVLKGREKFLPTKQGCYELDFFVLAKPRQGDTSCGSFVVRVEDRKVQQNARRARYSLPIRSYEATCKPGAKFCAGQKWNEPTIRYYVNPNDELLAFELYPMDSNRMVFVRTSSSALKL